MNALDLEPPLSSYLNCMGDAELETYESLCQDIEDSRNSLIHHSTAIAIACLESRPVALALCLRANQDAGSRLWQCAGRHAANRLRELFGPPIALIT